MTTPAPAAPAPHATVRRSLLLLLLAVAAAASVLVAVALLLPADVVRALFAEHGPAESVSLALWVLLGVVVLLVLRPSSRVTVAGFVVCMAAAAREGDLHTAFTGYSVLKIGFYHKAEFPLAHRLLAGAIVLVVIVSVITYGLSLLRSLRASRPARPAWAVVGGVGLALVVLTKIADRSPSILRNAADIHLAEPVLLVMSALEEGLEMVLPLVFGWAAILAALQRRALETPAASRVTSAPGAGILPLHASPRVQWERGGLTVTIAPETDPGSAQFLSREDRSVMSKKLYVGNLPFSVGDSELQELFSQHGEVQSASVLMDRETGRSRGFGFVEFVNDAEADAAVNALNGQSFAGRAIVVNEARAREDRPRTGGGGGGGGYRSGGGGGGGGYRSGGGGGGGGGRGGW